MKLRFLAPVMAALFLAAAPGYALPQKGKAAPAAKGVTTAGQKLSVDSYRGRVVIIDFFATWCPPCKESIPHLISLQKKYGSQGLQVVGFATDEDAPDVKDFVSSHKINYPVVMAGDEVLRDYGVRTIPILYVLDKKGNVAERFIGFSREEATTMETLIRKLLTQ